MSSIQDNKAIDSEIKALNSSNSEDLNENTKNKGLYINDVINMKTINRYVVFINPRDEDIIYLPKTFKHVFNYDFGKLVDFTNETLLPKKLSDKYLEVYLSTRINPNVFKREFNKIDYLVDIDDIDLILEIIIENGIIRKSLLSNFNVNFNELKIDLWEPDSIIHINKIYINNDNDNETLSNVNKYRVIIANDLRTLQSANKIKIQIYDIIFEINTVNVKTLNELYLTLYKYYIKLCKPDNFNYTDNNLVNSKIEWIIDNTIYTKIIMSLFDLKQLLTDIEGEIITINSKTNIY